MANDLMDGRTAFMREPGMPEPVTHEPARRLNVRLPGTVLLTPPD
jgi:hypothetical protein